MMVFKLTDGNMRTYNRCQWVLGEWHETSGNGDLCSSGWLHHYSRPLLAVLLNPIHAGFNAPRLFEAEAAWGHLIDDGVKGGSTRLRLLRELPVPDVTTEQRVRLAILCALEIYSEPRFEKWAHGWLSGTDRTEEAAASAEMFSENKASRARRSGMMGMVAAKYAVGAAVKWSLMAEARGDVMQWAAPGAAVDAAYALERALRATAGELDIVAIAQKVGI